jgi:hypothetical protein
MARAHSGALQGVKRAFRQRRKVRLGRRARRGAGGCMEAEGGPCGWFENRFRARERGREVTYSATWATPTTRIISPRSRLASYDSSSSFQRRSHPPAGVVRAPNAANPTALAGGPRSAPRRARPKEESATPASSAPPSASPTLRGSSPGRFRPVRCCRARP